jgi:hypothetical protein
MGKDGGKDTGAGSGTGSGTEDTGAIPVSDTDMAESTLVAESPSFHVTFGYPPRARFEPFQRPQSVFGIAGSSLRENHPAPSPLSSGLRLEVGHPGQRPERLAEGRADVRRCEPGAKKKAARR